MAVYMLIKSVKSSFVYVLFCVFPFLFSFFLPCTGLEDFRGPVLQECVPLQALLWPRKANPVHAHCHSHTMPREATSKVSSCSLPWPTKLKESVMTPLKN
ncbi:hypothetical protein CEXT_35391 [Caerostris extrusa]|uniref:Secreted protein n=1 Tax=Caerostris extrusa TaxID=172846 RepID=A0AAV4UHF5_CAEEX|nr:hypothetical protein CEXT_35391 [Caerostris extrusa]